MDPGAINFDGIVSMVEILKPIVPDSPIEDPSISNEASSSSSSIQIIDSASIKISSLVPNNDRIKSIVVNNLVLKKLARIEIAGRV